MDPRTNQPSDPLVFRPLVHQLHLFKEVLEGVGHGDSLLGKGGGQGIRALLRAGQVLGNGLPKIAIRSPSGGVELGVAGAHPLFEKGHLGLRCSIIHHVLEDGGMEGVEALSDQTLLRPAHEGQLEPSSVGPHKEDEDFLSGGLFRDPVFLGQTQIAQENFCVPIGYEIREAFPDKACKCVPQILGSHALWDSEPCVIVGHIKLSSNHYRSVSLNHVDNSAENGSCVKIHGWNPRGVYRGLTLHEETNSYDFGRYTMKVRASLKAKTGLRRTGFLLLLILTSMAASACSKGPPELPAPRPIVIRSGERLRADPDRMAGIDAWYRAERENIVNDPGFMIVTVPRDTPSYPWESLYMSSDSATFGIQSGYPEAQQIFEIYAHLRLMKKLGRIEEFLPGGDNLNGFAFEREALSKVADAWLLGRAVYQAEAFDPLEEILFASENGYLEAMILTARGDEFKDERQAWLKEDPEALERYRQWFVSAFSKEPPGLREKG